MGRGFLMGRGRGCFSLGKSGIIAAQAGIADFEPERLKGELAMHHFICPSCGQTYPADTAAFRCGCGGLFDLADPGQTLAFDTGRDLPGLWRFASALPFRGQDQAVRTLSLGEGLTPLIPWQPPGGRLWLKADYYQPTLSFKDRGAVLLALAAKRLGQRELLIDSSGNAGCAMAAYAARAGLVCHVFLPAAASPGKLRQLESYGARIHRVEGGRDAAAQAALELAASGVYYASHVYNPLFTEGVKTCFFEVFLQFGHQLPEIFFLPVGNGTLLLGAYRAFSQLLAGGYISAWPQVVMVQAAACAPLAQAFAAGADAPGLTGQALPTVAEGIAIPTPPRGRQLLQVLRQIGGEAVTVTEGEILAAWQELALAGIFVEKTAAASFAAYRRRLAERPQWRERSAVLLLCGAGLKSL